MAPANLHVIESFQGLHQVFFKIILLKIDKSGIFLLFDRQYIELINRVAIVLPKQFAHIPDHALFKHLIANTQAVQNIQSLFGEADCLAA